MNADEFRAELKRAGLTQKAFAEQAGYSREHVGRMAQGRLKIMPRVENVLRLLVQKEMESGAS